MFVVGYCYTLPLQESILVEVFYTTLFLLLFEFCLQLLIPGSIVLWGHSLFLFFLVCEERVAEVIFSRFGYILNLTGEVRKPRLSLDHKPSLRALEI